MDLSRSFRFDFVRIQAAKQGERGKFSDSFPKARSSLFSAVGIKQSVRFTLEQRRAVNQQDVTADSEAGSGSCQPDSIVKRRSVGHQCGGTHHSAIVCFGDGAIYAGSQAKVVSIDDEAAHRPV